MKIKAERLARKGKRVSFEEDPSRFDFEAPKTSDDMRRSTESPYRTPLYEKDDDFSDEDEVDKLLATDPLNDRESRKTGKTRRLSRKKRRVLIFGVATLLLGIVAALTLVGLKTHERVKAQAMAKAEAAADTKAIEEAMSAKEVPTMIGTIPVSAADLPSIPISGQPEQDIPTYDMPNLVHVDGPEQAQDDTEEMDQVISVPNNHKTTSDEAADKDEYDVETAKGENFNDPPELSAEAIEQVQGVNGAITSANADVNPLAKMKSIAQDFWAWIDAQWKDLMANSDDGAVIY